MEVHASCLLCNSTNLENLAGYEQAFLCKCHACGFVFSKRVPSLSELERHYSSYPRNMAISEITLKRYDELLSGFEKYRKNNTILDIGCGDGYFLERAKKKGWNVFGTEYTQQALKICSSKNISMLLGKLSSSSFNVQFDIITSFEVIEHINNPVEEILNIHSLLRKGGLFYFTTPNFNAASRIFLKSRWKIIEYPEHLSYYSCKTINAFLSRNGFSKKSLQTTGISLTQLAHGRGAEKKTGHTSLDTRIRTSSEKIWVLAILKKISNSILSFSKTGDTIKGHYIKR